MSLNNILKTVADSYSKKVDGCF